MKPKRLASRARSTGSTRTPACPTTIGRPNVTSVMATQRAERVDYVGLLLLAVGIGTLQTMLERGERLDWFESREVVLYGLISAASLIAFVWQELVTEHPVVDLRILRSRQLAVGVVFGGILGVCLYATVFVLPVYLQNLQNFTAEQTGFVILPGALASAFLGVLWPYHGWMNIAPVAGEIRNPQRNIPLSLLTGVLIVVALYLGANLAYYLMVSGPEMAGLKETSVATVYALRLLGSLGAAAAAAAVHMRTVRVENGSTLGSLIRSTYGDVNPELIKRIQLANPHVVDPDVIMAGDLLSFPEVEVDHPTDRGGQPQ